MNAEYHKLEFSRFTPAEQAVRAIENLETAQTRRSIRDFSAESVPRELIETCLRAALSAPSGANQQPWHFACISDPAMKSRIRAGAEKEEKDFYLRRAPDDWLEALAPLGTNDEKPYLEIAPWLICIFTQNHGINREGERQKHYYAKESVGIASGFLLQALHRAGLATLTHTPSPMAFLNHLLERPENEKPFMLLVVGFPAESAKVPVIEKKPFSECVSFH